jgi:hypothetical protein
LVYVNRPESALSLYKQALVAGLPPEQETWSQFQVVRLAHHAQRKDLALGGLRSLSENNDHLVRRMAALLQSDQAQPISSQGGR